jgi:hypothetical protein
VTARTKNDGDIALAKWCAARSGVSDWRSVSANYYVSSFSGCDTCGPETEQTVHWSWCDSDGKFHGDELEIDCYGGVTFSELLSELLAFAITDEDRSDG